MWELPCDTVVVGALSIRECDGNKPENDFNGHSDCEWMTGCRLRSLN